MPHSIMGTLCTVAVKIMQDEIPDQVGDDGGKNRGRRPLGEPKPGCKGRGAEAARPLWPGWRYHV